MIDEADADGLELVRNPEFGEWSGAAQRRVRGRDLVAVQRGVRDRLRSAERRRARL